MNRAGRAEWTEKSLEAGSRYPDAQRIAADTRTIAATSTGRQIRVSRRARGEVRRRERFASLLDRRTGRRRFIPPRWAGHRSDESVAASGQGLNEPRHIGRVPERVTQPANRGIQAVLEIDECLRRPQSLPQLLAGHEVAGTIEKRLENLKRLLGEIDPDAGLPQFARAQIQLERAKADEGHPAERSCRISGRQTTETRRDSTTPVTSSRICVTARAYAVTSIGRRFHLAGH